MAKFSPSFLISQASGKLGGIVFVPGKNQQNIRMLKYSRSRYNIATTSIKTATPSLISQFNSLSESLKVAWRDRVTLFPVTDRFGRKLYLSGQSLFVKANIHRLLANKPLFTDPPELVNYQNFGFYELILDPGQYEFQFQNNPQGTNNFVFFYATKPLSPGINSPGLNTYRYIGDQFVTASSGFDFTANYNSVFGSLQKPVGYKIFAYFFVQSATVSSLPGVRHFASNFIN